MKKKLKKLNEKKLEEFNEKNLNKENSSNEEEHYDLYLDLTDEDLDIGTGD